MKPEGHLARAEEIERSIQVLVDDSAAVHVSKIVEAAYGAVQHFVAYGMQRRVGSHVDGHLGLVRALNTHSLSDITALFDRLERLRAGRWYGGQGNGHTVDEALYILREAKQWSLR